MQDGNIDPIKKDLGAIKLKIDELEKSLDTLSQQAQGSEKEGSVIYSGLSFEEKKKEIENEIEKSEKRLELLMERKKRLEEMKKDTEKKEEEAKTPTERRVAEEQRVAIENERNVVEEERDKKESEIRLLKLELKGWDKFNFEKTDWKVDLDKNLDLSILDEEKQNLLIDLQRIETRTSQLREFMHDISAQREVLNAKLSEISGVEKDAQTSIKDFEVKLDTPLSVDEAKDLEHQRNAFEEKRRAAEEARWDAEDEIEKIETIYSKVKSEYEVIPVNVNNIKDRLALINKKIDSIGNEHI